MAALAGYGTLLAGSAVGRLLSFVTGVVLARHLSASAFGEFSIFFGVLLVVAEATNFIDFTYVRHANTSPSNRLSFMRASLVLKCVFLATAAILALPVGALLARLFHKPDMTVTLALAVGAGSLLNVLSLKLADYLADERYLRLTVFNTIYSALVLGVLIALIRANVDLSGPLIGSVFVGAAAVVAIVCFAQMLRACSPLKVEVAVLRRMLAFGKWLGAASLAYLLAQRLDLFVLSAFANLTQVGDYGAALRIAVIASIMTAALPALLLPRASRTLGSSEASRRFIRHALSVSLLVTVLTVGLWFAVPVVVDSLLGRGYRNAIPLTRIMLVGTVFAAFSTSLAQLFLAEDRPRKAFYFRLVRLVALVAFAFLLVPPYGGKGAAWAVTVAELFVMLYTVGAIKTSLRSLARACPAPRCGVDR